MTELDDKIGRAISRLHEIDEEIESMIETASVERRPNWVLDWQYEKPPAKVEARRKIRDKGRYLALKAEKGKLEELLSQLGAAKAEILFDGPTLPASNAILLTDPTSDAISWCVRTYKERKDKGITPSQAGIAGEALRHFFPNISEFSEKKGKTGKLLKNREWLLKRDSLRTSFLQKLPRRGKKT